MTNNGVRTFQSWSSILRKRMVKLLREPVQDFLADAAQHFFVQTHLHMPSRFKFYNMNQLMFTTRTLFQSKLLCVLRRRRNHLSASLQHHFRSCIPITTTTTNNTTHVATTHICELFNRRRKRRRVRGEGKGGKEALINRFVVVSLTLRTKLVNMRDD